ncbi:PEP-CTERM/exosortase system-associated acyltransferase [Trichloromonas sp.]|uniref:PEP-CTERM/exosortase system-associated acyltransferase n=1 Tax=Trichloromonas sp. TaxID=3069249 RepID=UPI003D817C72
MKTFEFKKIEQCDPLLKEVLALRYKVYCEERGFEKPQDHPDGLERDEYDGHSVHFAAIVRHGECGDGRQEEKVVGTVRLILDSVKRFPVEQAFEFSKNLSHLKRNQVGEISRLALSKHYCSEFKGRMRWQSDAGELVNGLLRCLAQESLERGITHLYAVMARGLPILLARKKILFSQIGPEKEYHGLRTPYIGAVRDIVSRNPELFLGFQESERVSAVA